LGRGATRSLGTLGRLDRPDCDLCGSPTRRTIISSCTDRLSHLPGTFDIVECGTCGHWYLHPRPSPDAIHHYYAAAYYTHRARAQADAGFRSGARSALKRVAKAALAARQGAAVEDYRPWGTRKLLDLGCGSGRFLSAMRRRGWEVTGLDVDPAAVETARAHTPDADIHCGDVAHVELAKESFTLIMASHVIEHVASPRHFLGVVRTLLAPGGLLVIRCPNVGSLEARLFGRRWHYLDVPRHLHHFRPATLSKMVEESGLHVNALKRQVLPMSISNSLLFAFEDLTTLRVDLEGPLAKLLYLACYGPAMLLGALGIAGSMEILAGRPQVSGTGPPGSDEREVQ
jgi:2-polyprenyl-3-methyl-5-hydroxy-6-metoxy-1,4-benzoquinol methylase